MRFRPKRDALPFAGLASFMRLPYTQDPAYLDQADTAIVGIPLDSGTFYRAGARFGPRAIRLHSLYQLGPYHPILSLDVFEHLNVIDYGDLGVDLQDTQKAYRMIQEGLAPLIEQEITPVCLGGDHSISYPVLGALASAVSPLALVHFDSHPDTLDAIRGNRYNHGTPFRRAAEAGWIDPEHSIQIGIRGAGRVPDPKGDPGPLSFEVISGEALWTLPPDQVVEQIRRRVGNHPVYLSFDLDVMDAAVAPGTGSPEIGGPLSRDILPILRGLAGLPIKGFDIVELLPEADPQNTTALLAANLVFEFLALLAHRKQKISQE